MTTTHALRQSTHQFLPFGIDFSIKDDHLGVRNTYILEELIDGKLSREYYFQTRYSGDPSDTRVLVDIPSFYM